MAGEKTGESRTFITYSRADGEFALRVANDLRAAGVSIWLDQLDIAPGSPWDRAVEAALSAAGRVIVILSPTSTASENVQDEIGLAFDTHKQIIPVLCKPCEVPMRLRRLQRIDFTGGYDEAFKLLLAAARWPITAPAEGAAAPAPAPMAPSSHPAPKSPGKVFSARNIGICATAGVVLTGMAIWLSGGKGSTDAGPNDPAAQQLAQSPGTLPAPQTAIAKELSCDEASSLRSNDGAVQTLTVQNKLANPVNLVWIAHDGKPTPMGTVEPDETSKLDTFSGHYWMLKDGMDQCLKVVVAPGLVTLP